MKGKDSSTNKKKVRRFKKLLSNLELPIFYEDERFSSIIAKKFIGIAKCKNWA